MDNFTSFLANNKGVFTWFSIAISLPSTLLYCAEIWTICWHKPFHNSFYTLFIVRASGNLVYTFFSYFFVRIVILYPEWYLSLQLPNWAYSFWSFISGYTILADNLAIAFILANRYTAIARALTHESIWRKFMIPVLLIVYGVPLFDIKAFWINMELLATRDDQGRVLATYYGDVNHGTALYTTVAIGTVCTVLSLALCIPINVAILWAYRHRTKQYNKSRVGPTTNPLAIATIGQQQSSAVNAAAKAKADFIERRLLLFAVFTFFGHVLVSLMMIILFFALTTANAFLGTLMNSQYSLLTDIGYVVVPSWLLLWASSSFRKQLCANFLPNDLYKRIFDSPPHLNTIKVTAAVVAVRCCR